MSHSNSEKAKKLKAEADADLKKFNSSKDRRDLSVHENANESRNRCCRSNDTSLNSHRL